MARTSSPVTRRPPFDPDLVPVLERLTATEPRVSPETLAIKRQRHASAQAGGAAVDLTAAGAVAVHELDVPGPDDGPDVHLTVLRPSAGSLPLPAIYFMHGGGMVMGDRYGGIDTLVPRAADGSAVVVSVEYRLAPEHPHPAPLDDCYAGLAWVARNAQELGIDPDRIMVMGVSAGAGLAAGVALLARDRGFPSLTHQVLLRPMLDDRMRTHSSQMLEGEGIWDRNENAFGWAALLGELGEAPPYAAPSRAVDLTGLPRTYLDTGSVDTFRDETLEYASRLSTYGVSVDLHVWGGGFHGFENQAPDAALSRICRTVQDEFIRRALAPIEETNG